MNRRDLFKRALGLVGLGALAKASEQPRSNVRWMDADEIKAERETCKHGPGVLCMNCPVGFETWHATYEAPPMFNGVPVLCVDDMTRGGPQFYYINRDNFIARPYRDAPKEPA